MRVNNNAQIEYEKSFNDKIDSFKEHFKYEWLRKYSDEALSLHTGDGLYTINAREFMDRVIAMPLEYIQDWLDDKNNLEWGEYKNEL